MKERQNDRTTERKTERKDKWMNIWIKEFMNEGMTEWRNEWMNERMKEKQTFACSNFYAQWFAHSLLSSRETVWLHYINYTDSEPLKIGTLVIGHLLVRSLVHSHRSLTRTMVQISLNMGHQIYHSPTSSGANERAIGDRRTLSILFSVLILLILLLPSPSWDICRIILGSLPLLGIRSRSPCISGFDSLYWQ